MAGQLPDALGKLHAQLKNSLEEGRVEAADAEQMAHLMEEIEGIADVLGTLGTRTIGPVQDVSAYSLGPAPTHCKACGQKLEKS